MRYIRVYVCMGLLSVGMTGLPAASELSAQEITAKMQRQIDGVQSLAADFTLTSFVSVLKQTSATTGRILLLKKRNKLRLEQNGQTIISDGKSVWTYIPENQQIIVSPADQGSNDMRPDAFLFYYTKHYTPTLVGTETIGGVLHYVMTLNANDPMAQLNEVTIWVDNQRWLTQQVVYTDDMGSKTTIRFSGIRLNPNLPDETFVMKTPEGVEVVDLR